MLVMLLDVILDEPAEVDALDELDEYTHQDMCLDDDDELEETDVIQIEVLDEIDELEFVDIDDDEDERDDTDSEFELIDDEML